MNAATVIATAEKYLGQTEIAGNKGWVDKAFEKRMKAVGWAVGHSWCAYFTELVWKEAYAGHKVAPTFDKLFSASATATYANFSASSLYKVGKLPAPGALAVWRLGTGWQGHIGIVTKVSGSTFDTIEGNTNAQGSREGMYVARKLRRLGQPVRPNGLNLVGFVYCP
jgi:hypothetical protein